MNWQRHRRNEIAISEAELAAMTSDLQEAHEEALPALRSSLGAWEGEPLADRGAGGEQGIGLSRRGFLARAGLLAAGGVTLAASGAAASALPRLARPGAAAGTEAAPRAASVDVQVAALAASLEILAVATYGAALSAASAGKLGSVPPAVATFAKTARAQHADHAAAWNAIVVGAGYERIAAPNAVFAKTVDAAFAKVKDVPGVAELALALEDAAAATYLEAVGVVSGTKAIATAASIQPVEMQHAAILNFVLGKYPVPAAYATTAGAATLGDAPAIRKR